MAELLTPEDNLAKYAGLSKMDGDKPLDCLFMEIDWSSNWLEYYNPPKSNQISRVRVDMSSGIRLGPRGKLVELNVGMAIESVFALTGKQLYVETDERTDNLSHCETRGMPPDETPQQCEVAAVLAESCQAVYPAVV